MAAPYRPRHLVVALLTLLTAPVVPPLTATAAAVVPAPAEAQEVPTEVRAQLADDGKATFWVRVEGAADLPAGSAAGTWKAQGRSVVSELQTNAEDRQADVVALLKDEQVDHTPFWVVNAVRVTGDAALAEALAARDDVAAIVPDRTYRLPRPAAADAHPAGENGVEWNVARIGAPEVWEEFGVAGEGIVVGTIDTGAQYDHPALVDSYRGNLGDGRFSHDHNWFDPAGACGEAPSAPCDDIGHGTHTLGTVVGDDGGTNRIGAAPGARWITARGCEALTCSTESLLAAAQWLLAPTNQAGGDPRPELRPNIINNSWSGPSGDEWMADIVDAWVAAGIFPVFANGNPGPHCGGVGSPADYTQSYGVGAFGPDGTIAEFSGRGPSALGGGTKPDIAAPGVDIRSAAPGGEYEALEGTSMAAPHVAATVALVWSAAPALAGDVAATRAVLAGSAADVADASCGGTAAANNVWGEGTLDAAAAVRAAPRGPTGRVVGTVRDAVTGHPVVGARVRATGSTDRTVFTGSDGTYQTVVPVGAHTVAVSAFGYRAWSAPASAAAGGATPLDVELDPFPTRDVNGAVRDDDGRPVEGATVAVEGTPLAGVTTDAGGRYRIGSVPEGELVVRAVADGCLGTSSATTPATGAATLDLTVDRRSDRAGHDCALGTGELLATDAHLPLTGDDATAPVELPFPFRFYGAEYDTAHINTNGSLNFLGPDPSYANTVLPDAQAPHAAVYALWDDLVVDESASIRTGLEGVGPTRRFTVEWRDVRFYCCAAERVTFQVVLHEDGTVETRYGDLGTGPNGRGSSATVGIEDAESEDALAYTTDRPVLRSGTVLRFRPPAYGSVRGRVRDAADASPLAGAAVTATGEGGEAGRTATDAEGGYRLWLPEGRYELQGALGEAEASRAVVEVSAGATVEADLDLDLPGARVATDAVEMVAPRGEHRSARVRVTNAGTAALRVTSSQRGAAGTSDARAVARPALVVMDVRPWSNDALTEVLRRNGILHEVAGSEALRDADLDAYSAIYVASDQPPAFYEHYRAALGRLTDYATAGGVVWVGAATWGEQEGDLDGDRLPGGARIRLSFQAENDVVDPDHPVVADVPSTFTGELASHAVFEELPDGARVVARGTWWDPAPTLVEYEVGAGRVIGFGQTLERAWAADEPGGRILENAVPYAYDAAADSDASWLSLDPVELTVAPGQTETVRLAVDASDLPVGEHRAQVTLRTNDPRSPVVPVRVQVVVPAYHQAVNAGSPIAVTDEDGERWAGDRPYRPGRWGYTGRWRPPVWSAYPIAGTSTDRLLQTARQVPGEYHFDGLPAGRYDVELHVAELRPRQSARRPANVVVEGVTVPAPTAGRREQGWSRPFTAAVQRVTVEVVDGQLTIEFPTTGGADQPMVGALRVTSRTTSDESR